MEEKNKFYFDARNCSPQINYSQIPNNVIRDKNISYKARGILILLLSHKDGWKTFMDTLCDEFSTVDGRTSVESGIKELKQFGYFDKKVFLDKNKRVCGGFIAYTDTPFNFNLESHEKVAVENEWTIANHPSKKKDNVENPETDIPVVDNEQQRILSNKKTNFNNTNSVVSKETSSVFDKTRQVDLEDVGPTIVENKEVAQTKNKPLAKDSVAMPTLENIEKVAPRPTPRKVDILKKKKPTPKVPQQFQEIIAEWAELGLVNHNPEKGTYHNAVKMLKKLMNAKFFESNCQYSKYADYKFTREEIVDTFERFADAALNFNYLPIDGPYKTSLRKMSLPNFLYSAHSQKSLFVEYFENPPREINESQKMVEDLDPETTVIVKYLYHKKYIGTPNPKFTPSDENNFRKTSNMLDEWFKENRKIVSSNFYLYKGDIGTKRQRVDLLFEAVLASIGENSDWVVKVSSSWFCSPKTFNERLPKYLKEMGIIT